MRVWMLLFFLLPFAATAQEVGRVVVSIKPLHALVAGVMGDTGKPDLLVTGQISPHDFQMKPSQMKTLQQADVVFYMDSGLETFLPPTLEALPSHIRRAEVTRHASLKLLERRKSGVWEAHEHGHHHDHHRDAGHDAHLWLNPQYAIAVTRYIATELAALYPEHRQAYMKNADIMAAQFQELDRRLQEKLAGQGDKPFIVFHDAFQYFEKRYGLQSVGSITFEPEESPSPARLRQLREKIIESGVVCVFGEPGGNDRLMATVTEGTPAKTGILDPEGLLLKPGADLYMTLMENMGNSLRDCLQ